LNFFEVKRACLDEEIKTTCLAKKFFEVKRLVTKDYVGPYDNKVEPSGVNHVEDSF